MDKKTNKKGFTIVELVAVIAVIAILAGVMIFTFSGMAKKAKESDISQRATSIYEALLTEDEYKDIDLNPEKGAVDLYIKVNYENEEYYFKVVDGSVSAAEEINEIPDGYTAQTGDYANVFVFADNGEG